MLEIKWHGSDGGSASPGRYKKLLLLRQRYLGIIALLPCQLYYCQNVSVCCTFIQTYKQTIL